MADAGVTKKHHALFVALPYQGHFTPSASLALKLAAEGFTITFVNTEAFHHHRISSGAAADGDAREVFADARSKGLDVRYDLVSDGLPVSLDRSVYGEQFTYALAHLLSGHVEELMRKLLLGDPPIDVLIADTFFVWPSTLAKKFGLPYVSFWTEPALVFALYHHMPLLTQNDHFAVSPTEERKQAVTCIPGVPAIEMRDLVSFFQAPETYLRVIKVLGKIFEEAKGADFVLCNTVQELEAETIAALQQDDRPFYAIGPIDGIARARAVMTNMWPESDCSQWLDFKPPGSVLYISFGSLADVSRRDMEEIAHGVLNSEANFVLVLRPGSVSSESDSPLLDGLKEGSQGRGIVVSWCSQRQVLRHPAVGGFLTHCGWNSILEGIWCGVPMLCFPVLGDQPTNRRLVVQDLRIGIEVGGLGEVRRDVVSSRIESLMGGEEGAKLRKEMEEVRKVVKSAVAPGGSSCKNWDQFMVDLRKHLPETTNVDGEKKMMDYITAVALNRREEGN